MMTYPIPKKLLKKTLSACGYEIKRKKPKTTWLLNPLESHYSDSAGKVIEFVAPSGAGKSHMLKLLVERLRPDWIAQHELRSVLHSPQALLPANNEVEQFFSDLTDKYLNQDKSESRWYNLSASLKIHYIKCCLEHMQEHILIENDLPKGVLVDEGLFFWMSSEIVEMLATDSYPALNRYLSRRVFVSIDVDSEIILSQIKERLQKHPWRNAYKGFTDNEMLESINNQQRVIKKTLDDIEPFAGRVVTLNAQNNLDGSLDFLVDVAANFPV